MRPLFSLFVLCFMFSPCLAQRQIELDKRWGFIKPCFTTKAEVEKILGNSISQDKNHSYQSYDRKGERLTVIYNSKSFKNDNKKLCGGNLPLDAVLQFFASTYDKIKLSELKIDLTKYKRDVGHTGREVSYRNEEEGITIVTDIVDLTDKTEIVGAVHFLPKAISQPL